MLLANFAVVASLLFYKAVASSSWNSLRRGNVTQTDQQTLTHHHQIRLEDLSYKGGDLIYYPQVVMIYVGPGNSAKKIAILDYFADNIGTSMQWNVVRNLFNGNGPFNIGPLTRLYSFTDTSVVPVSFTNYNNLYSWITALLQGYINSGKLTPASIVDTIYTIIPGPGFSYSGISCSGGFNGNTNVNGWDGKPMTMYWAFARSFDDPACDGTNGGMWNIKGADGVLLNVPTPNNDIVIDSIPKTLYHEWAEVTSDPKINNVDGWRSDTGQNADLCTHQWGSNPSYTVNGAPGQNANMLLSPQSGYAYSSYFVVQKMWLYNPPSSACVQTSCILRWLGDGLCNPENNNAQCNYDNGDCCKQSCVSSANYLCSNQVFSSCIDPAYTVKTSITQAPTMSPTSPPTQRPVASKPTALPPGSTITCAASCEWGLSCDQLGTTYGLYCWYLTAYQGCDCSGCACALDATTSNPVNAPTSAPTLMPVLGPTPTQAPVPPTAETAAPPPPTYPPVTTAPPSPMPLGSVPGTIPTSNPSVSLLAPTSVTGLTIAQVTTVLQSSGAAMTNQLGIVYPAIQISNAITTINGNMVMCTQYIFSGVTVAQASTSAFQTVFILAIAQSSGITAGAITGLSVSAGRRLLSGVQINYNINTNTNAQSGSSSSSGSDSSSSTSSSSSGGGNVAAPVSSSASAGGSRWVVHIIIIISLWLIY